MRSAALVFNPVAGRGRLGRRIGRVVEALREGGFETRPLATRSAGDGEKRAREAASAGAEVVFALGGDGTLRECAAGLAGSETALAFLPAGTTNVMALEWGLPRNPVKAARAHAHSVEREFGLGLAGSTPFVMQASAGVDAFLISALKRGEKRLLGSAAAVPAVLRSLIGYSFPTFEVTTPRGRRSATLAVASNIKRYGGPWRLTPQARSDGQSLELYCYSGRGRAAAIRMALALVAGRHLELAASSVERAERVEIDSAPGQPFQLDGDLLPRPATGQLAIAGSTRRLRVLAPPG